ncbi:MAG: T9SS type A sorting domain-containing protein [Bacteroidales bacterium]|nr:T9SS type A sorting domain-containing protein [Bacteroidales bacterium]
MKKIICGICGIILMQSAILSGQEGLIIQEETLGVCTMDGTVDSAVSALGYTGIGYANIDNGIGVGMSWSFTVPVDGIYKVTWRYALGGTDTTSRDGKLLLNNDLTGDTVRFPHTDSTYWNGYKSTDTISLSLQAGLNKIHLSAITVKGLPNIDYFHILGSGIEPAQCIPSFIFSLASNDTNYGTVSYFPVKEFYDDGEELTVTATAKPGYFFHSWSGEASDTVNPFLFEIRQNTIMTALFYPEGTSQAENAAGYATVQHDNGTPYIVTGGAAGPVVDANTIYELMKYLGDDEPYTVRLSQFLKSTGPIEIKVKSNKTFIGTNDTAHLEGIKIALEGARNVIIRDISFSKVLGDDLMELNAGSKNVWIDHCEFYTDREHDDNEDYYDGMLDIKNESSFITVSWCHFHDHNKGILICSGDDSDQDSVQRITFHHNYFYNCNSRLPSIRFGKAHIYNNYYEKCNTAVNTRMNACVRVEYNYFNNAGTGIGMLYSPIPGGVDLGENIYVNTTYSSSPACELNPPYSYESTIDNTADLPELITVNIRRHANPSTFIHDYKEKRLSLKGFPNPAEDWLTLLFQLKENEKAEISIVDITGQEVYKITADACTPGFNEIRIDVSGLPSGLYFYSLKSGDRAVTDKLVIK